MNALEKAFQLRRDAAMAPSRRTFLKAVGGGGGAMCIGFGFAPDGAIAAVQAESSPTGAALNAFVRIAPDNTITIVIPSSEMGQGVSSSLAMVLAEELDADWTRVRTEFAPADPAYKNLLYGLQLTGGSTTVRSFWEPMAKTGAAARQMLVASAAARWKIDPSELSTSDGRVAHKASKRTATYGELAADAAKQTPPAEPVRKDPALYKLVGKRVRRLDTFSKVTGRAVYGMDTQLPGLLVASIAMPPVHGSKLKRFDESKALTVAGVVKVVPFSNGVAVLARDFWTAKKGRDALVDFIEWEASDMRFLDSDSLRDRMVKGTS